MLLEKCCCRFWFWYVFLEKCCLLYLPVLILVCVVVEVWFVVCVGFDFGMCSWRSVVLCICWFWFWYVWLEKCCLVYLSVLILVCVVREVLFVVFVGFDFGMCCWGSVVCCICRFWFWYVLLEKYCLLHLSVLILVCVVGEVLFCVFVGFEFGMCCWGSVVWCICWFWFWYALLEKCCLLYLSVLILVCVVGEVLFVVFVGFEFGMCCWGSVVWCICWFWFWNVLLEKYCMLYLLVLILVCVVGEVLFGVFVGFDFGMCCWSIVCCICWFWFWYVLLKYCLVYLLVLILVCFVGEVLFGVFVGFDFGMCCWLWYFDVLLVGLLYVRCSVMVWFVFRLSCKIVLNIWACLLGEWCSHGSDAFFWTLLLREIQDHLYILIVVYKIQKWIYSIKLIFK